MSDSASPYNQPAARSRARRRSRMMRRANTRTRHAFMSVKSTTAAYATTSARVQPRHEMRGPASCAKKKSGSAAPLSACKILFVETFAIVVEKQPRSCWETTHFCGEVDVVTNVFRKTCRVLEARLACSPEHVSKRSQAYGSSRLAGRVSVTLRAGRSPEGSKSDDPVARSLAATVVPEPGTP